MHTKNLFFLFFLLFKTSVLLSQETVDISFAPIFESKIIKNDSIYCFKNENNKRDSINFENIKFYVTNIHFLLENKLVFTEKNETNNGAHLIDLGGYQTSNNALQTVVLPIKNNQKISIYLDISAFIKQINWQTTNQIMSPSKEAVLLSKRLAGCFSIIK
jgi:hypothetical protein